MGHLPVLIDSLESVEHGSIVVVPRHVVGLLDPLSVCVEIW
jgi:hypothetical protein